MDEDRARLEAFGRSHPEWTIWQTGGLWFAVRARQRPASAATPGALLAELDKRVRGERAG